MNEKMRQVVKWSLTPFSWIYGAVTDLRNWLFDHNWLQHEEYDVPVITVGNITIGGTGKTPHVEYLVEQLAMSYRTAVLSRGYKRKTRGFILANSHSTPETIGDEPMQIYNKYGSRVVVAVCENRRKGIGELLRLYPDLQLIILDDGFQHRYVKPRLSVLLMDYSRPVYDDHLLPLGRLRESAHQKSRADMVIVSKCPESLSPLDYRLIKNNLELMPFQKLYFSTYNYGALKPVFPDDSPYHVALSQLSMRDTALLVTGVANPRGFIRFFRDYPFKVVIDHYPDHHDFTRADIEQIVAKFDSLPGERKVIITTEKDAVRLAFNPYFPTRLKKITFYLPISIRMLPGLEGDDIIMDIRHNIDN